MPTLNWIGKAEVQRYNPPFHFLNKIYGNSENAIIHGDNLLALKSLLPRYENKIKCIYIDPPYNTGNEGWIYNDNVSDSRLQKWLGQVVGKEGEDLTRHDKWLCMMYPRLRLLQRLLRDDGAIFISVDDNEQAALKFICDEIFGASNFIATIHWHKNYASSNDSKTFSTVMDYILVYRKSESFARNLLPRTEKQNYLYKYDSNDGRGRWRSDNLSVKTYSAAYDYSIQNPNTKKMYNPPKGRCWITNKETMQKWIEDGRVFFGQKGDGAPQLKRYLSEVQNGVVPTTYWSFDDCGHNDEARKEIKKIFNEKLFDTPKPTRLIERILQLATDKNSIVLDSFAGSGTTAHAVINLNKQDGGNRKFILIELNDYAESITAERVRRVGGEFSFYELGESLFDEDGFINSAVPLEKIFEYIYYSETRQKFTPTAEKNLLGVFEDTAYYFFNDSLNWNTLAQIKTRAKNYVIYAESCNLSENELMKYKITFKQIPFDVRRY